MRPLNTATDPYPTDLEAAEGSPRAYRRRVIGLARPIRARPGGTDPLLPSESDAHTAVRRREGAYRRNLAIADLVATVLALVCAVDVLGQDRLRLTSLALLPLTVIAAKVLGLYDRDELLLRKSTLDELPKIFNLATLVALFSFLLSGWLLDGVLGRDQTLVLLVLLVGAVTMCRAVSRQLTGLIAATERCLVLGDAEVLERLRQKLDQPRLVELVGSVPFEHVVNDATALREVAALYGAHRLILAPGDGAVSNPESVEVIRAAKATGLRVSLLPGVLDVVGTAVEFDSLSGMTLLGVRRFGLTRSSTAVKRTFDMLGAWIVLLLAAPVMVVIAALVKIETPGPVFFRQTRVGRDGHRFQIIKFRSMVDGADARRGELKHLNEAPDGLFKIADDPRVTRVGTFIRKLSLDELPQLLNVLRGEMSLVGPRPLIVDEDQQITGLDRQRLQLTPGMTGPWQIAGSARVPLSEMVKLDYLYVAGWSTWADTKILVRTALYMLARRGQ